MGRMRLRRLLRRRIRLVRFGLVPALILAALLSQAGTSLALFTASRADAGSFASGVWAYYLHNNPTPPVGNTTAQTNLSMNTTRPTSPVNPPYQYSTNCSTQPGRRLTRAAPSATQATVCDYVNWRASLPAGMTVLSGTITVDIWSATDTTRANRTGSVVLYLRDYNPANGSYAEINNGAYGLYNGTYAVGRTFYHTPVSITLTGTYTLAATHQLEVKLEASNTYQSNMLVAYDTTTYVSFVRFR